ncbi:MAG TPA: hypothetical protein VN517_06030 [Terriglobales bacterium]|jgi:hypothetical protein|nr:hypothetical protein [Terriglobales bacterium]
MKSNWTTGSLIVAALLLLIADGRLDLLAIVAPVSILVAMLAFRHAGSSSVEYRRKR